VIVKFVVFDLIIVSDVKYVVFVLIIVCDF